ncbi:MAG: IclR family transcriptional regulator [Halobacteriota archaeon]|uniref:IclR family transcriptional regulator n=1 Tax=Natronomonas sp. TaxID=2184060 RepID=UPI003974E719
MPATNSSRLVQSTMTSLRILELIRENRGARLTDIAQELDIGYSTAHNHLATLHNEEWLVKENDMYKIPYRFLNFGRSARQNTPFFSIVRRHASQLSNETNMEVEFLVEEYGRIISLIDITTNAPGYTNVDDGWEGIGIFYYMNNTASGKAILAEMSEKKIEEILDKWGLPGQTPYSVTDRDTLYQQLEATRENGYATAHQEVHEGFENAATVVKYPDNGIFGAISIGWPSYLFDNELDQRLIKKLMNKKREIEVEIAKASEDGL